MMAGKSIHEGNIFGVILTTEFGLAGELLEVKVSPFFSCFICFIHFICQYQSFFYRYRCIVGFKVSFCIVVEPTGTISTLLDLLIILN
ncbi:hypothetical protein RCL_jg1996.t1 [Rhizophagus clarus]|uniref:Uncharacterized protein n=1 Tax=Rhizophagus clarus TaxID=94130 RepID=A0A8H3LWT7_9GLOM|nr:hypothetical protein RCL_jg1996.t1 [Rhizophagus clarus]